jgi:hypothetical protein
MLTLENRTKIVTALRSGGYTQIRAALCFEGGYCCIGVAGVVCGLEVEEGSGTWITGNGVGFTEDQIADLIELNDGQKNSFPEIANVIESFPVVA